MLAGNKVVRRQFSLVATLLLSCLCTVCPATALDRDYYYNEALSLTYHRHWRDSLPLLNKAIALDPKFARAYYLRGSVYLELEQRQEAKVDLDHAIKLDTSNSDAYDKRARLAFEEGRHEDSIRDITEAIRLDPKNGELYKFRYKNYFILKQFDKALAELNKGVELEPNSSSMHEDRGRVYVRLGQWQKALVDYCAAVKLENRGAGYIEPLLADRAKIYDKLGMKDLAAKDRKELKYYSNDWGFVLDK